MRIHEDFEPSNEDDRYWQPKHRYRPCVPTQISPREFLRLFAKGYIVDGRMGGMILGKDSGDGPARLIFKVGSTYLLQGFVQGGCFLVNREASALHRQRLVKIATGLTRNEVVPESHTDEIGQLIVVTGYPHDRLIWTEFGQMVVNKEPAMKHVIELGRINLSPNQYLMCDYHEIFGCEPGTPDGCV
jgi:hypothetical protein